MPTTPQTERKQVTPVRLKFLTECCGKFVGTFQKCSCSIIRFFPGGFGMRRHSLDALNYFFLLSLSPPQTRCDDKLMSSSTMWPFSTYIKSSSGTFWTAAAAVKSLQSCPTLCDAVDSSLPGSSVLGILQARMLEGVAISFSNAWKWKVKVK